jgi:hypothetical protein
VAVSSSHRSVQAAVEIHAIIDAVNHVLHIPVSPSVLDKLQRIAERDAVSLEQVAATWLEQNALEHNDPLDDLIGSFESRVPDWLEQHDQHIGNALSGKVQ